MNAVEASLHPALREVAASALLDLRHEHALGPSAALVTVETAIGPATLALQLQQDTERVVVAAHRGGDSPERRSILDLLCETVVGLPIEEAAAHGVVRLLHRLVEGLDAPLIPGVLLPRHGGSLFIEAEQSLHRLRDDFRRIAHRAPPPHAAELDAPWAALGTTERAAQVERVLATCAKERGLSPDGVRCEAIEDDVQRRPVRVVLSFSPALAGNTLPALIRSIERRLKRDLAPQIEVVTSERADRNKLRRMITIEKGPSES